MNIIDDSTALEVGKFYNVRCAIMSNGCAEDEYFVPIIGPLHNDNQFDFPYKHYHVDGRFASKRLRSTLNIDENGFTNSVCHFGVPFMFNVKEVVVKRLKCRRLTTGVRPPKSAYQEGAFYEWYRSMIGKSCKGKKCPHLGVQMTERNGVLVCPLHGLNGSIKTERIIKPTIQPTAVPGA